MLQIDTTTSTKDIVQQFAAAVQNKDFEQIASLLAEDGKFNTQDAELNTLEATGKDEFMNWFIPALSGTSISSIEYDTCILCKMGNPVVLFNDGKFPARKLETASKSMTGLMLDIADGLICGISFCYYFATRENKYQYECLSEEVDKLVATGMTLRQAASIVLIEKGYMSNNSSSVRRSNENDNEGPYIDRY